jgi:NAD(P)-dependent dehydrogenase (short-subunit alcohol dehydrogenase family)
MLDQFPQKRAIITGGASGLGQAFAALLLADNWTVGIADNNPAQLAAAVAAWDRYPNQVFPSQVDVTQADDIRRLADAFIQRHGGVDVVINCAGVGSGGAFESVPLATFEKVMAINFNGVLHSCKTFVPVLLAQRSGLIINISSVAAFAAAPSMCAYNVSKAAVTALTETLQAEYASRGLRFAVVMPTFFRSNLNRSLLSEGRDRELAEKLITEAKVDAGWVARKTLRKVGRGAFYVVLPADSAVIWFLKRHFPRLYLRLIHTLAKRQGLQK